MRVPQVLVARQITKLKNFFLLLVFTKPGICHIYYLSETEMFKKQSGVWFRSYRETLVDVHTARRICTMNDESRVTGASEEK